MLAKGRHSNRDHIEPIIQILSKLARLNCLFKMFVGCSKDPSGKRERAIPPKSLELSLLQCSQQLRLQHGSQLANLIEEDCSILCGLELSLLRRNCPSECTFLVSE